MLIRINCARCHNILYAIGLCHLSFIYGLIPKSPIKNQSKFVILEFSQNPLFSGFQQFSSWFVFLSPNPSFFLASDSIDEQVSQWVYPADDRALVATYLLSVLYYVVVVYILAWYVDQARGLDFHLGPSNNTRHTSKSPRVVLINLSQLLSFSERTECN